jgi:hypothetical protein
VSVPSENASSDHPEGKELPLALEVIRSYLRHEARIGSPRRIQETMARLQHPTFLLRLRAAIEPPSVSQAIQRSEQQLPPSAQRALASLAQQFPPAPEMFSEQEALDLLNTQGFSWQELDRLVDAGLVETTGRGCYHLHPVVAAYARLSAHLDADGEETPCAESKARS